MIQNTQFMIQNTLFVTQNTPFVNQITQNTLFVNQMTQNTLFLAFMATVEKIMTYTLGELGPKQVQDWKTSGNLCHLDIGTSSKSG